jgi:hypothetical protein
MGHTSMHACMPWVCVVESRSTTDPVADTRTVGTCMGSQKHASCRHAAMVSPDLLVRDSQGSCQGCHTSSIVGGVRASDLQRGRAPATMGDSIDTDTLTNPGPQACNQNIPSSSQRTMTSLVRRAPRCCLARAYACSRVPMFFSGAIRPAVPAPRSTQP